LHSLERFDYDGRASDAAAGARISLRTGELLDPLEPGVVDLAALEERSRLAELLLPRG